MLLSCMLGESSQVGRLFETIDHATLINGTWLAPRRRCRDPHACPESLSIDARTLYGVVWAVFELIAN